MTRPRSVREIPRSFAIATKETTAQQFLQFRNAKFPNGVAPETSCPINVVTWLEAVAYCRWLSERDKVPADQMCYPRIEEIKEGMKPFNNFIERTGYRLPTEAEMEYASRAGSVTSRFPGDDVQILVRYAYFANNAYGRVYPVGGRLPNDFGLFDVLGNVKEWCQDSYVENLVDGIEQIDVNAFDSQVSRVARGGSYTDRANILRSANRYFTKPDDLSFGTGFRVARTVKLAE